GVLGRQRHFSSGQRSLPIRRTTTATTFTATARRACIGRKPRQSAVSQQTPGDFSTRTATSGSGVKTGLEIIHKTTWLIRKGRMRDNTVCCVVVRGSIFLSFAARLVVAGISLASVSTSTVCVSVSAWTDYAFSFVLLPFALCLSCFLIRAKRGFGK